MFFFPHGMYFSREETYKNTKVNTVIFDLMKIFDG